MKKSQAYHWWEKGCSHIMKTCAGWISMIWPLGSPLLDALSAIPWERLRLLHKLRRVPTFLYKYISIHIQIKKMRDAQLGWEFLLSSAQSTREAPLCSYIRSVAWGQPDSGGSDFTPTPASAAGPTACCAFALCLQQNHKLLGAKPVHPSLTIPRSPALWTNFPILLLCWGSIVKLCLAYSLSLPGAAPGCQPKPCVFLTCRRQEEEYSQILVRSRQDTQAPWLQLIY